MTASQQRLGWVAVVVLGVLLPFAPAVLGLRTLAQRDTDQLYAPVRTLVVEALRDGRLPLWNPYEGTGKPLFAEGIHSVLHPISLLGAAVAPSSIDFLILAYLVAAALGAFLLARALDASPPASAGAGLAYALSGFSASMTGNLVFLAGLSTLPWLLAAARTAGRGDRWGIVLTALATASAFFSGDVQVTVVGLALGLLLAADAGGPRGAGRALAGSAPGILLAGAQILATYELLPLTLRGVGLEESDKVRWALEPGRLLEWIVPGLFRGPLAAVPVATSGATLDFLLAESVYLGAPMVAAAAFALRAGRRRTALLICVAGLVLLWLALGHHLGARQLLDRVPVWSRFRYSEKLMAPLALCLAALAALGIDRFGAGRLSRAATRLLGAGAASSAVLLAILWLAPDATANLAARALGDAGPFYRSNLAAGLPQLTVALGVLLALNRIREGSSRVGALALLVAVAPAAAVYQGAHLGSAGQHAFRTPLVFETDSPVPRIAQPVPRVPDASDPGDAVETRARLGSLLLYPAVNVAHRVDTVEPYAGFEPLRLIALARSFGSTWAFHFRRFGLTHVALPTPVPAQFRARAFLAIGEGLLVQRDESLGFEVWSMPHRPWAFFAPRSVHAQSPDEANGVVLELIDRDDDGTVVVEAPQPPQTAPGRVLAVERGTERLRVEAESLDLSLLVIQDAFWPGWRASIDGQPAEILAADYVVRAVRWPRGRHTLEMVYDPPEMRTGLALSALGAILLLILAAIAFRRVGA